MARASRPGASRPSVFLGILLSLVSGLPLATRAAEEPAAPAARELTELLNRFLDGASRNEASVHERFWAEDLIYTSSAGERTNKQEILAGLKSGPEAPDAPPVTYSAEDIRIHQYGDTAVVAFRLVGKTGGDKPETRYYLNTGTFLKRNGEWRAIAWQATHEAAPAESPKP